MYISAGNVEIPVSKRMRINGRENQGLERRRRSKKTKTKEGRTGVDHQTRHQSNVPSFSFSDVCLCVCVCVCGSAEERKGGSICRQKTKRKTKMKRQRRLTSNGFSE